MKILIIPSATLVSKEMQKKVGTIPTVLCPIKDHTMLDYLVEHYHSQVDQIVIVGFKKVEVIQNFIKYRNYNIHLLKLDELKDLGYTVTFGIRYAIENFSNIESLYINFADTLVEEVFPFDYENSIVYSHSYKGDEWTYFQNNEHGSLIRIWDKTDIDPQEIDDAKLFVGVASVTDVKSFYTDLQTALHQPILDCDSLYQALYSYSQSHNINFIASEKWLDVGHTENYSKAKTSVAARVFNTIEVDEKRGILKKTSKNKGKLINEINWYLRIPEKLQYLLPRIYNYSTNIDNPYVEMEYYGYNTLHELLIWGDLSTQQWENYFHKLNFIIEDMQKYKYVDDKEKLQQSLREIYTTKTVVRLQQLEKDTPFSLFFTQPIILNGIAYDTLNNYISKIPVLVEKILINNWKPEFTIIHGDLCFANILIENNYGFMRVIDPRGEFGGFNIYGDPRYELAKLLHSIEGKYDFIIEDMFNIKQDENEITFGIMEKEDLVLKAFKKVFQNQLQNYTELQLIEAMLFLSMIPLHSDYPSRQLAMLATGIQLFESVLTKINQT